MENRLPSGNIQEVPLSERNRIQLQLMRRVDRGDSYVARGVGIAMLLVAVLMGWTCLESSPFDWGLLIATVCIGLFGILVTRLGRRKKTTADIFETLLEKGTKQIVKGRLEGADMLADGALRYRIDGADYDAHVLFVQPYPFVAMLDKADVLPAGDMTLHLVSWAPGKYYRLQADDGRAVELKQVIGERFLPQGVRHSIMAWLVVSAVTLVVALVASWLAYGGGQTWSDNPELAVFFVAVVGVPALLAFNLYRRTRRRYKVITVARGKVSEVLVAHVRVSKNARMPLGWYTVGGETLQVDPDKPIAVGTDVEIRYVEQPNGGFPLPVSITPLTEG